jgi:hypothetical protein
MELDMRGETGNPNFWSSWRVLILQVLTCFAALLPDRVSYADAIVFSNAMFASTIAEYMVEDDHVRVELEIGAGDVNAFRNLLPDGLYEKLEHEPRPAAERVNDFFKQDLVIFLDGQPIKGFIAAIGPETRVKRDAVTGEPLPSADEEAEVVIAATLIYPFRGQPASLSLGGLGNTGPVSIGFVLYHKGVAVNDFRYLTNGVTVHLDWEDPWYSAFEGRSMQRQYFSPMTGFIYIEPYEVRKEIILRPKDIQRWSDLGLEGVETITPEMQETVKSGIVNFLDGRFQVSIDGQPVDGTIDRINFLERTLRSSVVVDKREIDLLPATVGVIYVFPTDGLPQKVEMEWDIFTERMNLVPASTVDQAGPLPIILEPGFSTLVWENFLKHPELPTLEDIRMPPSPLQQFAHWAQWLFAGTALLLLLSAWRVESRGVRKRLMVATALSALLAAGSIISWRAARLNPDRTQELVGGLLHNVYRAFDHRGEETVYDVLALSVSGDLLADVYLETRKGLVLANQGGARVKVNDVEVLEASLTGSKAGTLQIKSRWSVGGSVGHWGHIHQRRNGYHAMLEISDVDGRWKLTGLEILQEERL